VNSKKIKEAGCGFLLLLWCENRMSQPNPLPPKKKANKSTTVAMNEDLKQFLSAEEQDNISKTIEAKLKDKKPQGKCSICRLNPSKAVCIRCGSSVCNSCYLTMVGLCQNCLSKETVERWKNKKTDWKSILEVDWVD